ncbi:hypothetical protein PG991_002752 [Apiospora marii]|uniref:Zn(2)-C6 fungal-type domain-containing protein n=1 Tax=Apiospora marii TaxID=335849 RepID=A0ABR1SGF6_9PEZI
MAAQTASKTTTKPVTQHKRRPHKKSRHGCGSCKKFHVKAAQCDESGPPCGNCILRQVPCEYPTIKGPKGNRSPSLAAYSNQHSDSASSRSSTPSHQCPSQQPSLTLSPWGSDRLLELELMHRWCTRTYTGFVAVPEDAYYCMGVLPRLALEYSDVLLSTIMATAALDTAMTSASESGRGSYARISMQYYDKASAAFRDPALSPTPENHHILVFVSAMLVIFNLAISQITTPSSSSKGAAGAAAVVAGNNNATRDMAAYSTEPVEDSIFVSTGEPDDGGYEMDAVMDMIDPRIIQSTHHDFAAVVALTAATTRQQQPKLKTMGTAAAAEAQHYNLCCSLQPAENNSNYMQTQADVDLSFDYYQKVIAHLERFYAEDARDAVRCFLLAYPTLARRDLEARRGGGGGGFTPGSPWSSCCWRTGPCCSIAPGASSGGSARRGAIW